MEVDLRNRHIMCMAFGFGNQLIHRQDIVPHLLGKIQVVLDDVFDPMQTRV